VDGNRAHEAHDDGWIWALGGASQARNASPAQAMITWQISRMPFVTIDAT